MKYKRRLLNLILCILIVLTLPGCGHKNEPTKIILTNGFHKNEIFKIEDISCTLPEIMVYLTNIQNQYEAVYGAQIWDKTVDDQTIEENIKDMAIARISQIKTIVLLARRNGVYLSDDEILRVQELGKQYYSSLNKTEIDKMGVNEAIIIQMYEEYALAQKMYNYVISDINPEISDDEARTITVEHILLKTYDVDNHGNLVDYPQDKIDRTREKANDICMRAKEGESFEALADEFSEDENLTISFGKGEMEKEFETAAFNLGTDEISEVVQTKYGFHIIKCISTFNKEITDENKVRIVEERKQQAFSEEYDAFASTLVKNINAELWDEVSLIRESDVITDSFFELYDIAAKEWE